MDLLTLATEVCATVFRPSAPRDTGNLQDNAIKVEQVSENEVRIYVDEAIAPYMPYTNEPWLSPKWNGKQNPNEGWFDKAVETVAQAIATKLGGDVTVK